MEKKRSLGVNFIFNMMRTMMGVIIPLITFPYSSRVLGPEALGKVDYAQANMTYFTLLQAFGVGGVGQPAMQSGRVPVFGMTERKWMNLQVICCQSI